MAIKSLIVPKLVVINFFSFIGGGQGNPSGGGNAGGPGGGGTGGGFPEPHQMQSEGLVW